VKFVDEATITVQSGDGGRGCVSFRREKFVPRGGPDGGDGGNGGDVILEASAARRTLFQFRFNRLYKAKNGGHGQGKNMTGKSAADLVLQIPPGTLITNADTGEIVNDFTRPGETTIVARGGRGGQGNARFKSSTHQAPRFAQPGESGETLALRLELKLLADVGIIGLPNAGKSTLISSISAARPKIANYPFTTLTPSLGVVKHDWGEPFVVADIPGLIEGAHKGIGLGTQFLRHVERTRVLVHLIDASGLDADAPLVPYDMINRELDGHDPALSRKPQLVVLNKMDLPEAQAAEPAFRKALGEEIGVMSISAATGQGLDALISRLIHYLDTSHDNEAEQPS
jgi:GTP-binding protein